MNLFAQSFDWNFNWSLFHRKGIMNIQKPNLTPVTFILRGTEPVIIAWGDGTVTTTSLTTGADASISHTYTGATNTYIQILNPYNLTKFATTTGSGLRFSLMEFVKAPNLTIIDIEGSGDVITGDFVYLPRGLITFISLGASAVTGNLVSLPKTLTFFQCNVSAATGDLIDLPRGLTYFYCNGTGTVSGNLNSLPTGLTYFFLIGSNTVTGLLSSIPSGVTTFQCIGLNTISGNLATVPAGLVYLFLTGNNTVTGYTYPRTWAANMREIYLIPVSGGLSSAEVDQLCINLSAQTWTNEKILRLTGTNGAPTAASLTARNSLTAQGVAVTTN